MTREEAEKELLVERNTREEAEKELLAERNMSNDWPRDKEGDDYGEELLKHKLTYWFDVAISERLARREAEARVKHLLAILESEGYNAKDMEGERDEKDV